MLWWIILDSESYSDIIQNARLIVGDDDGSNNKGNTNDDVHNNDNEKQDKFSFLYKIYSNRKNMILPISSNPHILAYVIQRERKWRDTKREMEDTDDDDMKNRRVNCKER